LLENPGQTFQEYNADRARRAFATLKSECKFSKFRIPPVLFFTCENHPTHYLILVMYSGRTATSDVGYGMVCLPHKEYPSERALLVIHTLAREEAELEAKNIARMKNSAVRPH
jgi:hypothetical protein